MGAQSQVVRILRSWRAWALAAALTVVVVAGASRSSREYAPVDTGEPGPLVFGGPCANATVFRSIDPQHVLLEQQGTNGAWSSVVDLASGRVIDRSPFRLLSSPNGTERTTPAMPRLSPGTRGLEVRFRGSKAELPESADLLLMPCRYALDDFQGLTVAYREGPTALRYGIDLQHARLETQPSKPHPNRSIPGGMNAYPCRGGDDSVAYDDGWGTRTQGKHVRFATTFEGQPLRVVPPFLCDGQVAWNARHVWWIRDGSVLHTLQETELAGTLAPSASGRYLVGATNVFHVESDPDGRLYGTPILYPAGGSYKLLIHTVFLRDLERGTVRYFPAQAWRGYEDKRSLSHKWVEDDRSVLIDGFGLWDLQEEDFVVRIDMPVFGAMSTDRDWVLSHADTTMALWTRHWEVATAPVGVRATWVDGPVLAVVSGASSERQSLRLLSLSKKPGEFPEVEERVEVDVSQYLGPYRRDFVLFVDRGTLGIVRIQDGAVLRQVHQVGGPGISFTPGGWFTGDLPGGATSLVSEVRGQTLSDAQALPVTKDHPCFRASLLDDFFAGRTLPQDPCDPSRSSDEIR